MSIPQKRTATFIGVFTVITLAFWLGGFNFDKRGETLGWWFFCSMLFSCFWASYPFSETKD